MNVKYLCSILSQKFPQEISLNIANYSDDHSTRCPNCYELLYNGTKVKLCKKCKDPFHVFCGEDYDSTEKCMKCEHSIPLCKNCGNDIYPLCQIHCQDCHVTICVKCIDRKICHECEFAQPNSYYWPYNYDSPALYKLDPAYGKGDDWMECSWWGFF